MPLQRNRQPLQPNQSVMPRTNREAQQEMPTKVASNVANAPVGLRYQLQRGANRRLR